MEDEVLLNLLSQNPALRQRIEGILRVAGNLQESIELVDTAEEQLIEESRHLNREALQAWASSNASQSANRFEKKHKSTRRYAFRNFSRKTNQGRFEKEKISSDRGYKSKMARSV